MIWETLDKYWEYLLLVGAVLVAWLWGHATGHRKGWTVGRQFEADGLAAKMREEYEARPEYDFRIKQGARGRWRWEVVNPETGKAVAIMPGSHDTEVEALEALKTFINSRVSKDGIAVASRRKS